MLTKTSMKTNQTLIDQLAATPNVFFNVVNNGDGTCKITSYNVAGGKVLVIPSEINGLIVTTIGNTAFQNKGLTSDNITININENRGWYLWWVYKIS